MKQSEFIKASNIPARLIRAVVRQHGGDWDYFCEHASDVSRYGADSGWPGFTYYSDTMPFFRRNRQSILEMAEQMADDVGYPGMLAMIASFGCLKDCKFSQDEIAKALYTSKGEHTDGIQNAMAWFALEEVARSYCDCLENAEMAL
jgi:hypothetical protein